MRVIAGSAKGHPLKAPKGEAVRPTTDRVKEGIFSSIQQRIPSSIVVDLFAGSGSLSIECLSRKASHAYLVEWSADHVQCIQENLHKVKRTENATILQKEVQAGIQHLHKQGVKADLVFMDPPYQQQLTESTLELLSRYDIMSKDGIIVAEHGKSEILPEKTGMFLRFKQKKYGDTMISYYRKEET